MKLFTNYTKAFYAGLAIGLGGIAYLSVESKVLGAFLFSIGLTAVLVFGFNLYTGKVCYISYYKQPMTLLCIWLGNLIGAAFISLLVTHDIRMTAATVVAVKLSKTPIRMILDSVLCGLCIAIAVRGYNKAEGIGKYLCPILGVMVFILIGAEHVVANMFYFAAAGELSVKALIAILLNTIGNTVGGFILVEPQSDTTITKG